MTIASIIRNIYVNYFSFQPSDELEEEIKGRIKAGTFFRGANLWTLVFAILIASLGLNVNSTAVIIGAMLISPMMGPILGIGLSFGINDFDLLKHSFKNYLIAASLSVLTASLYFLLTPLSDAQSELLARTYPTLYDVLIALCGGAAGIVALGSNDKGNVLPGVAIATALMPPLCTVGYGIATSHWAYSLGALYLFFINTVFIALSTFLGVRLMGFKKKRGLSKERETEVHRYMLAGIFITLIPASILTYNIITKSVRENNIDHFVSEQFSNKGILVYNKEIVSDSVLSLTIIGNSVSTQDMELAESKMIDYKLSEYKLEIVQGNQTDSLLLKAHMVNSSSLSKIDEYTEQIQSQSHKIDVLKSEIDSMSVVHDLVNERLLSDLKIFIPGIKSISMAPVNSHVVGNSHVKDVVLAYVELQPKTKIKQEDKERLKQCLMVRMKEIKELKQDSLQLLIY